MNIAGMTPTGQPSTPANTPIQQATQLRNPAGNPLTILDNKNFAADMKDRTELLNYTPSASELKYLMDIGAIRQSQTGGGGNGGGGFSGGGSRYNRRGRGGGGGRGGLGVRMPNGAPVYDQRQRLPAFSSGTGFKGLINWRI
jgi:hypothetical protein